VYVTFVFTLTNGIAMISTIAATSGIGTSTLSLHDALPISVSEAANADFVLLASACLPGTPGAPNSPTVIVGPGSMAACSFANEANGKADVSKQTTRADRTLIFARTNGVTMSATIATSPRIG